MDTYNNGQYTVYRDLNVYPFLHVVDFVQNSIIEIDLREDYTKIEVLDKGTWSGDIIREKEAARPRTPS